jgi:hypothetical protein
MFGFIDRRRSQQMKATIDRLSMRITSLGTFQGMQRSPSDLRALQSGMIVGYGAQQR